MDFTQISDGSMDVGAQPERESFAKLLKQYERSGYREGDIAKGRVIKIEKDYALIDIGYKSEGQVQLSEFMDLEGKININIGDEVYVYVESVENEDGTIVLSKEKADKLKIWELVSSAYEKGTLIDGIVTARVKGGLTVDIGVKAFLPGSQIDLRPVRNLDKYIGQKFSFKVIKYNRKRGNIVLSRRALLEKEREELKKSTLSRLEEGLVVEGVIKNITDYGCFVDLGGIDGLLHTTDMSWGRVKDPVELFKVGDVVRVKVLKFDQKTEKVSLGVKQLSEDPWSVANKKYKVGDRVKGKVVSFADYGAFVELEDGIEGLIHLSDMSWVKKVKHPSKMLNLDEIVETVVLEVDGRQKKIALGLKQTEINPWVLLQEKFPAGSKVKGKIRNITNFGLFVGIEEGIDGLVHMQDITWSHRVKNPLELYKKGQVVEAVVLGIDPEKEKFALSIKHLTEDPWNRVPALFPIGSIVEGTVTKVLDFGAIVELTEEIEGLVHISEVSTEKVENVAKHLKEGDRVKTMVININPEERKLGLSIKRYIEAEESGDYENYLRSQKFVPTTLGDLIKKKIDVSVLPTAATAPSAAPESVQHVAAETAPAPVQSAGPSPVDSSALAEKPIQPSETDKKEKRNAVKAPKKTVKAKEEEKSEKKKTPEKKRTAKKKEEEKTENT